MTAAAVAVALRIPADLLAAAGWRDVSDAEARDLVGTHHAGDLSGWAAPYLDPRSGARWAWAVRRRNPDADGKRKYLVAPGHHHIYFPPAAGPLLGDASVTVALVEGVKSSLALTALAERAGRRLLVVALGSCWGWRGQTGIATTASGDRQPEKGPHPDLALVEWAGRDAIIALDGDVRGNPSVAAALRGLAHELVGRGANVRVATVPEAAGEKAGPDDVLQRCGDDAALAMLDASRPWAECARAAAEAAIAAMAAAGKGADPLPAIEAVAAVDDTSRRDLLAGRLVALRLPGVTREVVTRSIGQHQARAEAARRQAAEAARRGRLLGMVVDGAALLDDIAAWLREYVVMTPAQADVCAFWVLHSHALDAADYTPYLHITAPEKRCGKSRLLEALELLAARAWRCDRTTAAALLRSVERDTPTLLLDEWDAAKGSGDDYAEAMRGLLNSGFRRGGSYRLCAKGADGEMDLHDYPTFCAKAIAGIGRLPDTVADRSLTIVLRRKAPHERVQPFRRRDAEPQAAYLRERCEAWAMQAIERLRDARPGFPAALNDRQRDICEPLLAIADLAGGDWPGRARRALVELCTGEAAQDESIGSKLLADVRAIFAERQADRIASKDLAEALGAMEDRPWAEWGRGAKPITPPQVARQLGRFGIAPRSIRLGDGATPKGYLRDDFCEALARYLAPDPSPDDPPPPDMPVPNRHTATNRINTGPNGDFESATADPCGGSENAVSPSKDGPCGGVAVPNQQNRGGDTQTDLFTPPPPPKAEGETWGESIARARAEGRLPAEPEAPRPKDVEL